MSKHTPGPWAFHGDHVTRADEEAESLKSDRGYQSGHYVCTLVTPLGGERVRKANARLIAAAPGLLAGCKELLDAFDHSYHIDMDSTTLARAAIAEAEGETE